jgi:hypothetical protein
MDQVPGVNLGPEFRRQFGRDEVDLGAGTSQAGDLASGDGAATHHQAGLMADIKEDRKQIHGRFLGLKGVGGGKGTGCADSENILIY